MAYPSPYFHEDKTKLSHDLCQILDGVTHGCPTLCSIRQICPYVIGPVCDLAGSKQRFGFVSQRDADPLAFDLLLIRIRR